MDVVTTANTTTGSSQTTPIRPILSKLSDDFDLKYEILHEIGRGGFSTVFQCQNRLTQQIYAVKAIDLRPLRLRENFDPKRLKREVDIMKGLHHPNIIQFQDVYETENQLLVVMEYAPGKELFDVILEKSRFPEDEAKPIFYQIASALAYMHSNGVIHRDIKPENILVLNELDPLTGIPIVKILDFGLSKQTGGGSMAKTFVGTPCYLAPEVEQASLRDGSTYDTPADCWSLGAVLYVMLVAHFPEFDRNVGRVGRVLLRLPPHLWKNISSEGKNLVQGLLCYETDVRLSASDAMRHDWIGQYKDLVLRSKNFQSHPPLKASTPQKQVYDLVTTSYENQRRMFDLPAIQIPSHYPPQKLYQQQQQHQQQGSHPPQYINAESLNMSSNNMISAYQPPAGEMSVADQDIYLHIVPLMTLQQEAIQCFQNAEKIYSNRPEVITHLRAASLRCKQQLQDSIRMLRKIEQTSIAALDILPDMEMALEAGEPKLIAGLLGTIKNWVSELVVLVSSIQSSNEDTIQNLHQVVNISDHLQLTARNLRAAQTPLLVDSSMIVHEIRRVVAELQERGSQQGLTDQDILELFSNLFGQENWKERGIIYTPSPSTSVHGKRYQAASSPKSSDVDETIIGTGSPAYIKAVDNSGQKIVELKRQDDMISAITVLREVNDILSQLSVFWSNTDVILDALTKKGQHIETFVAYTHNPNLVNRFQERMTEYRKFWERIKSMCLAYLMGMQEINVNRLASPPEVLHSPASSPQTSFT